MALGAHVGQVLRLVLRQGAGPTLVGVVVGGLVAMAARRLLASMLYGVSTLDPVTYIAAPLLLVVVSLLASAVPARRATRVDPVIALRAE
jgi:ABC-type antimicrobial peptide transport system permease subunit